MHNHPISGLSSFEKKILRYIWDNTDSEPDMVDVHNLLAKLKRDEDSGTSLSDRVSETLDRFCEADNLAVSHVDIDRDGAKHALIKDERAETLRLVIQQFKRCNPSWSDVQCVVVDKDFTEIGVFREELPEARILRCQFHAIKYIQERISKTEYGLDAIQRSRLKQLASLIVRAGSEEEYRRYFDFMKRELHVVDELDEEVCDGPFVLELFPGELG
ncbi:unnamed protein product [Phytophthora fragariaefolia]|uniref:Unnamed protein product n=1 Tax=Phytophthora fragariaefolia TaxID=1490495 RepID=A0A9W7D500_9STRA|nr:unnamed protein product [Phytophthora fragariaefolia]